MTTKPLHSSGHTMKDATAMIARMDHAGSCVVRALAAALASDTNDDADRYAQSAIRFAKAAKREAWLLGLV